MLLTVFFAFWLVEFPANFTSNRHWTLKLEHWIGFIYSHTVPEVLVLFEWLNSCIQFEWRRFGLYFLAGVLVLLMNVVVTLAKTQPYASLDWED